MRREAETVGIGVSEAPNVVERTVEIINEAGLHARPVMQFVDTVGRFRSSVRVQKESTDGPGERVDGASPMEMMLLEAPKGTRLAITAQGDDAAELVDALAALVAARFGED